MGGGDGSLAAALTYSNHRVRGRRFRFWLYNALPRHRGTGNMRVQGRTVTRWAPSL